MININVVGLGFVGLTTLTGFASKGFKVNGIEKNKVYLERLKKNKFSFFEPYLKNIFKVNLKNKKIKISNQYYFENDRLNIFFVCVGTPSKKSGEVEINQIIEVINKLKNQAKNNKVLIVIKSTVPPGTTDKIKKSLKKKKNINVAINPEFLREGFAWKDFMEADKVVLGVENVQSKNALMQIYKNFKCKKIIVNIKTAEFIKYLSNSILANLVSFSNEITILGEQVGGIDIKKSFEAVKLDKRWFGNPSSISTYLHPGMGYGGYCLPKDLKALNYISKKLRNKNTIINSIIQTNQKIFDHQIKKIKNKIKPKDKVYILGLSFKPHSDDLRDSKSVNLIKQLVRLKFNNLIGCDPMSIKSASEIFNHKIRMLNKPKYEKSAYYILATAWPEYIKFSTKIKKDKLLDLRYLT